MAVSRSVLNHVVMERSGSFYICFPNIELTGFANNDWVGKMTERKDSSVRS